MGSYILTLFVTHQQEYAIQKLFAKRGWKFTKAEFKDVELPAVKPDDVSDYSDSDVDQHEGSVVYQQGDIFVETNTEYTSTGGSGVDKTRTVSHSIKADDTKHVENGKTVNGAGETGVSAEGASEDTEVRDIQTHIKEDNDDVEDYSLALETDIKLEPRDNDITETGDHVKSRVSPKTSGKNKNKTVGSSTGKKVTPVAISKSQKRKVSRLSNEEIAPKQQRRASASAKALISELAKDIEAETQPDGAQSDSHMGELQDYKLETEQTSDIEHSDGDYVPEQDEKTSDIDNSDGEVTPQKPAPLDMDSDGYSKSLNGYFCRDCGNAFKLKILYTSHKRGNRCVFTCKHCKKQFHFKEYNKFLRHQKGHTVVVKPLKESFEGKDTHSASKLCPKCGRKYDSASGLTKHLQNHTRIFKYVCSICSKGFIEKHQFSAHMPKHGHPKLSCDQCKRKFTRQFSLQRHLLTCHNEKDDRKVSFACQVCDKTFGQKGTLRTHMEGIHMGLVKYSCELCNKKYKWRTSLSLHVQSKH